MDIYIIRNGAIVPYLKDGMRRNAQLPVLPPDVARIEVTWMAEDDVVSLFLHAHVVMADRVWHAAAVRRQYVYSLSLLFLESLLFNTCYGGLCK